MQQAIIDIIRMKKAIGRRPSLRAWPARAPSTADDESPLGADGGAACVPRHRTQL